MAIDYTFRPGESVASYNARIERERAADRKSSSSKTSSTSSKSSSSSSSKTSSTKTSTPTPTASSGSSSGGSYVIKSGDNLSSIAARNGTTVAALAAANGITDPNKIRAGATLVIPGKGGSSAATTGGSNVQDLIRQLEEAQKQLATMKGGDTKTKQPMPSNGSAYFSDDYALVKVVGANGYDSGTVWLVDVENKTMRPFSSTSAIERLYGRDFEEIEDSINVVDSAALAQGGVLHGFQALGSEYAIKKDGTAKALDYSPGSLSQRYGAGINEDAELRAYQAVDGFMDLLKGGAGKISSSQLSKAKGDSSLMAFYISALAYGGYSLSDVYSDLKRRELGITNAFPISASQPRTQYQSTPEYKAAVDNPKLKPPTEIEGMSSSVLNLPLYDIPSEAFKKLTPLLDPDSDEFQDAMDDAVSSIYESQLQMLTAENEQDLAMAQAAWEQNKKTIERTLGISLSNNVTEAWKQIESYQNDASTKGIYNSGLMNETVDEYLRQVRNTDQQNRESTLTQKEQQDIDYFTKYASPAQIKAMIDEDQAAGLPQDQWRASKWGLIPSQEIQDYFSMNNLKKLFPDEKEETLQKLRDQYIDPNGYMYSNLYGTYSQNMYNTGQNYDTWKRQKVFADSLLDEEEAYSQYTKPDSEFLRGEISEGALEGAGLLDKKKKTVDLSKEAKSALGRLINQGATGKVGSGTSTTKAAAPAAAPAKASPAPIPAPKAPAPVAPAPIQPPKPTTPVLNGSTIKLPTTPGYTPVSTYQPAKTSPLVTTGSTGLGQVASNVSNWVLGLFGKK